MERLPNEERTSVLDSLNYTRRLESQRISMALGCGARIDRNGRFLVSYAPRDRASD